MRTGQKVTRMIDAEGSSSVSPLPHSDRLHRFDEKAQKMASADRSPIGFELRLDLNASA
jgi:hypothetical protein